MSGVSACGSWRRGACAAGTHPPPAAAFRDKVGRPVPLHSNNVQEGPACCSPPPALAVHTTRGVCPSPRAIARLPTTQKRSHWDRPCEQLRQAQLCPPAPSWAAHQAERVEERPHQHPRLAQPHRKQAQAPPPQLLAKVVGVAAVAPEAWGPAGRPGQQGREGWREERTEPLAGLGVGRMQSLPKG